MSATRGDYVSVIIPAYNRERYIVESVQSALSQGPCVGEVIVVDDGSKDETVSLVRSIDDKRIRVVPQANQGPARARQNGWQQSTGSWVIFLDSDDALEPGCVTQQLDAARKNPGSVIYGLTSVHSEDLNTPPAMTVSFSRQSGNVLQDVCFFTGGTIFTGIFPVEILEAVGGFAPASPDCVSEDIDFAVRLAVKFPFVFLPIVTYRTRNHTGNTYKNREFQQRIFLSARVVMQRHLPNTPAYWPLRWRSQAFYLALAAQIDVELGRIASARKRYLQSLLYWPVKVGAWKGLIGTVMGSSAKGAANA